MMKKSKGEENNAKEAKHNSTKQKKKEEKKKKIARSRDRTSDLQIFSLALSHLSYSSSNRLLALTFRWKPYGFGHYIVPGQIHRGLSRLKRVYCTLSKDAHIDFGV